MAADTPHSAEYFGEQRDFWWNHDFLELMARRWGLPEAPRILDVGCGVGHWGRLMLSLVSARATLVGIDREPKWVEEAARIAALQGLPAQYQQGDAAALPFEDESFDVVTCQTVLIHLRDPEAALAGMRRVLKRGGLLIVAEPQNLSGSLMLGKTRFASPAEEVLAHVRMQLLCERGKQALGEGHNSIGELVPGMFARLGLTGVAVYQSDMASPFLPPYASPAEAAQKQQLLDWADRDFWYWDREDTQRWFLAGGGSAEEFERNWAVVRATSQRVAAAIRAGTEESVQAGAFFLISGRR
ncbi:MAG: class I SAM-dependent methyltransferase [Archangium sp.]|nr:class I SAM-dependent methyltransferase [Archangium sp.]